jgi:hypothetical protein
MKLAALLAVCGAAYGFQAQAPAKGSIEGQVVNLSGGAPLKKATIQLNMMNPGGMAPVVNPLGQAGTPGRGPVPVRKAVETDEQGDFRSQDSIPENTGFRPIARDSSIRITARGNIPAAGVRCWWRKGRTSKASFSN